MSLPTPYWTNPDGRHGVYLLIKKHAGSISNHNFATERELKEHLEAMWKFTDAELIAIVKL